ncbi:MAG: amino acid adenylation domain-containing protein, partial [Tumebacillaceae bacterium]
GAAYVPVDPDYPEDRVQYILANSNCKVFLGEDSYETEGISKYPSHELDVAHYPADLAYVIYTSGSTGRPKGVVITHQAAANTVQDMNRKFAVGPEDRILGISSLCFDLSVYDIFGALAAGATLVQIADQRDVRDMIDIAVKERITVWNSVPAILDLTVDTLEKGFVNTDLRVVLLSGDKIPLPLPDKVKKHFHNASVISLGGATEASIWSIYYPIDKVQSNWKTIPYGMPLANQTFYALNPQLELCPIGVQGELFIGGVGLAEGYLNDEEKTRAAFFVHPKFGPLYKTGDHGVWRAEGYIEFLGRIDHQVKIRGYRVELGEIETTLMQHPSVKNATVIDRTDAGGKKYLCAYIVPETEGDVSTPALREHLGSTLPDYMVPTYFVTIEAIPLTPNGKVDRKALPEPEVKAADLANDRDPRNETEEALQAICQDVLGIPNVSVVANFFEMGLNSVLMVQMINRIGREMNAKISFRDFVRQNNIEQLAVFIGEDGGAAEATPVTYEARQPDPEHLGEEFPLTDIQMAYLLGRNASFELGGISNHFYGEVISKLDMTRFQAALNVMIKRHPMLRAIVLPHGVQQILLDVPEYEVVVEDLRHLSEEERTARLTEERDRMSHYTFPTDQWPLFEFKSMRLDDETHMLLFGYDMLIADQASMEIFTRELMVAYREEELPALEFTFRDYMIAYEEFKSSETYKRDRAFWLNKLEAFPSAPTLPLKENPLNVKEPHFHNHEHLFTQEQWAELKRQANQRNITPSALLATAYATVLAHWSNQPQLALNLTVFNRYPFHEDVPAIVGDFTSVMLVDVNLQPERTLWEEASELQATLMDALEHRHYDGVEFIREYSRQHNLGTKAAMPFIFTSALFGDQSQAGGWHEMGELKTAMNQTSQLYIDHQVSETVNNELSVRWFYVDQLFEPQVIGMMFEQYVGIVLALTEGKDAYQFELTESDAAAIERYNQTEEPIRKATLHELFAEQAAQVPDQVAVKLGDKSFTYRELDLRSNQIAHALRAAGVQRGDGIGVLAKRVPETIANMLGILKAGAAYVPVDPAYPEDRQAYILENSACKLFLQPNYYEHNAQSHSETALTDNFHPEDVAYVIYTSGSTGRPKGVVIAHHAAANTIQDINNKFEVNANDRIIGVSSMCFDLSVYDIFGALSTGATLVMIENQRDVDDILDVIEREQITFWNSAPPIMDMVVEGLGHRSDLFCNTSLRAVLLSGDWIPLTLPEKVSVYFPNSATVSLGGATEASIWSIYYPVDEVQPGWASIPYGRPLANQTFHVLNYRQEPCPVGVMGELYIGGVGLAEGYHNDLEKTVAAFIDHPQLGRLYRTGDYGILHQGGYIEFMGRKDSQVKIRGYRVELNEINSNLVKHPALSNAIVIDRTDANRRKYLCAYYVPEPGAEVTVADLRETLEKDLPEYMVPAYFVQLDAIPLTPNGKVDRKALPEPDLSEGRKQHVEPQTEVEKQLASIWQEVLEIEIVGTQDDFFDIGGNSLLVVRVKGHLDKLFPDRFSFADLFACTTIEQLAASLEE